MARDPLPWQSRVPPGQIGYTDPTGRFQGLATVEPAHASIYDALGGAGLVLGTGSALAKAQVPSDLVLVDGLAQITFPSLDAPETPLVRALSAAASFMLGLAQPTGLVTGRRVVFHLLVTNTGAGAITLFLADAALGRVPLYYHSDHAAARPTIAAGATDLIEVTYLPAPERAIVRKVPISSAFRRTHPVLIGVAMPAASENYTFADQVAGDYLVASDFRTAATNQAALREGFVAIQQTGVASEFALRLSGRLTTANAEVIPFPASNPITRCLILCLRGVDAVTPVLGSASVSGTGINATIPAVAASEPGLALLGICGRNNSGSLNWQMPPLYSSAGINTGNAGSTLVKAGLHPDMIGIPAGAYTTPGATQAWGTCALLLRGAAL